MKGWEEKGWRNEKREKMEKNKDERKGEDGMTR